MAFQHMNGLFILQCCVSYTDEISPFKTFINFNTKALLSSARKKIPTLYGKACGKVIHI